MGTLHAALNWARRGFPVFPLIEGTREPMMQGWEDVATTNLDAITRMWTDPVLGTELNYNIGCKCNDIVVVDIDVKNGKTGLEDYTKLDGHFDTLVVRTTTGGYHCYFYGPESSNASLTKSVDIRSHNGYVVAPGSMINGIEYQVVNEQDLAWVPVTIERMLKPPYVRSEMNDNREYDSPASVQAAIDFLINAPVAIEGQRGDETTFITAARLVRELALSPSTAFHLMVEHWNNRCLPPWDLSELQVKVENAAQYGSAELGRLTAEDTFGHLGQIQPPPSVFEQGDIEWGNATHPTSIRPRPWLMDRALMLGAVTLLMAAGSAGKSTISLALAAHLALGKDFAGYTARKPCKSIIYNGEDDVEEQSRRLLAVCLTYGFEYSVVKKSVLLLSSRELKMELATNEFHRVARNQNLIEQIIAKASPEDVGLLILDPLVKVHKCDESDNVQMDGVMEILTDIARGANIAILALHHTSKGGSRQEERVGNMDIARGASAVVNASRIAFTLLNAAQQDAEDYGFPDSERHLYVRLDDAKMNMSLATTDATWFRREGLRITSGDVVGVLRHTVLKRNREHIRFKIANLLIASMEGNGQGSLTCAQAVALIKTEEPLWKNKTDSAVKKQIEGMYMTALTIGGKVLQAVRLEDGKNFIITLK